MNLIQKLQLKPGMSLSLLNLPTDGIETLLAELQGLHILFGIDTADAVLLFVDSLDEAQNMAPAAIRAVRAGGLLWIAYPKGASKVKTDVNRDRLWEALKPTGWRPVRQIALDEVWSAMRFRPSNEIED